MRGFCVLMVGVLFSCVSFTWSSETDTPPRERTAPAKESALKEVAPKDTPPAEPAAKRPSYKGFTNSKVNLLVDYHLNMKGNAIGNTVDLGRTRDLDGDGKKEKDEVAYLSYIWDVKVDVKYDGFLEFYLGIDSDGPLEFGAPLVGTRDIHTLFGTVDYYRHEELLPQVDEVWLDLYHEKWPAGIKMGLFRYDVGNSIAGPGYYPNYGANIHGAFPKGTWTFHYHRPELNREARPYANNYQENKLWAGPSGSDAHYFGGNVTYQPYSWFSVQPYINALLDYTDPEHRVASGAPGTYDRDVLGTVGADFNVNLGKKWQVGFEAAANFGGANGTAGTRDLSHRGWMFQADATYTANSKLTARFKTFMLSGQKHDEGDLADGDIYDGRNTEFSVYSPTNGWGLFDTNYSCHPGPYVFTAGGSALNFGVSRPSAAGDPYPHVNLWAVDLGVDWKPMAKLSTSWDIWVMNSVEPGYGSWQGRTFDLPHYLGAELDMNHSYQLTDHVAVQLQAGLFLPGSYYRKKRDDTPIYSWTARTDGSASPAYQVELGFDIKF